MRLNLEKRKIFLSDYEPDKFEYKEWESDIKDFVNSRYDEYLVDAKSLMEACEILGIDVRFVCYANHLVREIIRLENGEFPMDIPFSPVKRYEYMKEIASKISVPVDVVFEKEKSPE